jgi:hypothetical protein
VKRPSGKFVIRIPPSLHSRLKDEARQTGLSLNRICVMHLQTSEPPHAGSRTETAQSCTIPPDFLDRVIRQWQADLIGVILFGSAARGDATEASDIDLLLVMRPQVRILRHLYRLWEQMCQEHAGAQDVSRMSPHFAGLPGSARQAGGLWYEASIDRIVLWERDRSVSRFLCSVREAMAEGKMRRRMLHGSPYRVKDF